MMTEEERSRLAVTATDLARWQGSIEAAVRTSAKRLDDLNGSIHNIDKCTSEIKTELGVLRTKIAFASAIGGLLGAGLITVVPKLFG